MKMNGSSRISITLSFTSEGDHREEDSLLEGVKVCATEVRLDPLLSLYSFTNFNSSQLTVYRLV